jgi:hypothetical protein
MAKLNWEVILYNIRDAREQLQEIENLVNEGHPPSKIEFHIKLEHTFHHLCVAWNARQVSTKRYANLSDKDFNEWSKLPKNIKPYKIKASSKGK